MRVEKEVEGGLFTPPSPEALTPPPFPPSHKFKIKIHSIQHNQGKNVFRLLNPERAAKFD